MSRMFGDIQPAQIYDPQEYNPNRHEFVSKTLREVMESRFDLPNGRGPELRPSSFPICSVLFWMHKIRGQHQGYYVDPLEYSKSFFCDVGTIVHEVTQYHMGRSGKQFGHWKCVNPKCSKGKAAMEQRTADGRIVKEGKLTRKFTTNHKCPTCKQPMFYVELSIKYKGFKGHIDGVWEIPKELGGGYWVIDYKTSSTVKIKAGNYPESKHLYQLPTYAYILKKKYKMDIRGFSLIYIARDNPHMFYEYREPWAPRWEKWAKQVVKDNVSRYRAVEQDLEENTFRHSIAAKPCSCEAEYFKKMHGYNECPMLDVCFKKSRLKDFLKFWRRTHKSGDYRPGIPFTEAITVLSKEEAERARR